MISLLKEVLTKFQQKKDFEFELQSVLCLFITTPNLEGATRFWNLIKDL